MYVYVCVYVYRYIVTCVNVNRFSTPVCDPLCFCCNPCCNG